MHRSLMNQCSRQALLDTQLLECVFLFSCSLDTGRTFLLLISWTANWPPRSGRNDRIFKGARHSHSYVVHTSLFYSPITPLRNPVSSVLLHQTNCDSRLECALPNTVQHNIHRPRSTTWTASTQPPNTPQASQSSSSAPPFSSSNPPAWSNGYRRRTTNTKSLSRYTCLLPLRNSSSVRLPKHKQPLFSRADTDTLQTPSSSSPSPCSASPQLSTSRTIL